MDQLHRLLPLTGRRLTVDGQLRSFNNKSGSGSRLVISVFAQLLTPVAWNVFYSLPRANFLCEQKVAKSHLRNVVP